MTSSLDSTRATDDVTAEAAARGGPSRRSLIVGLAIAAAILLVAGVLWMLRSDDGSPDRHNAPILESITDEPTSGAVVATLWSQPSAVVVDGDRVYILDTGNNRILSTDGLGVVDSIICETDDCAFTLNGPEDMDLHDGLFYVANTGAGTVEVIDPAGSVVRTLEFPADADEAARTTGVYVANGGTTYVSDATSGRVGIFGADGEFQSFFGEANGPGALSFAQPAGLTIDKEGNLYVAEFGAGRIQKLSAEGRHLAMFWMIPGAVNTSEAADVVIGDNGFVYMADNKRSVVHVFAESGKYLGIVGLVDASRPDSTGALLRPYGLAIEGDRLTVIDRTRGQLVFRIIPEYFLQDV